MGIREIVEYLADYVKKHGRHETGHYHILFMLLGLQRNSLSNILDGKLSNDARVRTCASWVSTLWKISLPRPTPRTHMHTQIDITFIEAECELRRHCRRVQQLWDVR